LNAHGFLIRQIQTIWQRKGIASTVLLPLSWIARWAIARKKSQYECGRRTTAQSSRPVLVIGNLYVGGTGKTPVVIALAQALKARGWQPGVISRGYRVAIGKQARAGRGALDPAEFGDEPALIARLAQVPVAVHPQRVLALRELERAYPDVNVIISDDGLQHRALGRDIELVVQDDRGLGNGRVLPAGPLREPADKMQHVDYVITHLGADQTAPEHLPTKARQLSLRLIPAYVIHVDTQTSLSWTQWRARYGHASISAVAGIGQPERFFSMLRANGIALKDTIALPDHYSFAKSPFHTLTSEWILITAKDAVKCAHLNDERLWAVDVAPQFSDKAWLSELSRRLHVIAKEKSGAKLN
jgi:tetraacyldisaccharide 4'-kinase